MDLLFRAPNTKAPGVPPRGHCTLRDQDWGLFVIANYDGGNDRGIDFLVIDTVPSGS